MLIIKSIVYYFLLQRSVKYINRLIKRIDLFHFCLQRFLKYIQGFTDQRKSVLMFYCDDF